MTMWDAGSKRESYQLIMSLLLLAMIVFQQANTVTATSRFLQNLPANYGIDTMKADRESDIHSQSVVVAGSNWISSQANTRRILQFGGHPPGGPSGQGTGGP